MLPVDPARYALFASVMALFAITPGPANLFAIATGIRAGPAAAWRGVVGMNAATLVWFAAAGLGMGSLAGAYPAAFRLLAIAGGLYVAWLGVKSLWSGFRDGQALRLANGAGRGQPFRDGFAVQLANPKVMVFFTGVLPPFLDTARPLLPQIALLGATTITMDLSAMSFYGLAGGRFATALTKPTARRGFAFFVGVLLLVASALILTRA